VVKGRPGRRIGTASSVPLGMDCNRNRRHLSNRRCCPVGIGLGPVVSLHRPALEGEHVSRAFWCTTEVQGRLLGAFR
jgi:hypothetical protein